MAKRLMSAIFGITYVVLVLVFNGNLPVLLNISLAAVSAVCVFEVCSAMGIQKIYGMVIPALAFSLIMPLFGFTIFNRACFLFAVVMFCALIAMHKNITFKDMAVLYSLSLIISYPLGLICQLRDIGGAVHNTVGIFYIVICLVLPWTADAGAYFIGSAMGKHKLCPNISPKKSVEGAVGGVIISVLCTAAACLIFQYWIFPEGVKIHYFAVILMSLAGAGLSILGDLSFSLVKRGCHIKDLGNVLPGHGGLLDRFDSVIFVVPMVYFVTTMYPVVTI